MTASHNRPAATDSNLIMVAVPAKLLPEVEEMVRFVETKGSKRVTPETFTEFEEGAVEIGMQAARAMIKAHVEKVDNNGAYQLERDGETYTRLDPTTGKMLTAAGGFEYQRSRYRRPGAGASIVPMQDSLGLIGGYVTRAAARRCTLLMAHLTPREVEAICKAWGPMAPSVSTLQRMVGELHQELENDEDAIRAELREEEAIPEEAASVAVSLDGVMVPLRAGEDGRKEAAWREAACGTLTYYDGAGKRLHTQYHGQMPQAGKKKLKALLRAEVENVQKRRPDLTLLTVADGAADNWRFLDQFAADHAVLDFFHAAQYLKSASEHAKKPDWFDKYRLILRDDVRGVDKVIRALRYLRGKAPPEAAAELSKILGYFRKHRKRMRYKEVREANLPIGSGVVEAANKTLVTNRLKRSGMRWTIAGGQTILTFRALAKSGQFDAVWSLLMSRVQPAANDNQILDELSIVARPQARAA